MAHDPHRDAPDAADTGADPLLDELVASYRERKAHGEAALAQLRSGDWHQRLDPGSNSIAIIVRHLAGNMRSRWRDFLTSDGEKPDRDRDGEFEPTDESPAELMAEWEEGWRVTMDAVTALRAEDLTRTVTIRGEPQSVARALVRQLAHYSEHVGQIVLLAKHLRGESWRTLSIPKTRR